MEAESDMQVAQATKLIAAAESDLSLQEEDQLKIDRGSVHHHLHLLEKKKMMRKRSCE